MGGEHDQSVAAVWQEHTLCVAVCAFAEGMIDKARVVACDSGVDEDGIVEFEHIIPPAMVSDIAEIQKKGLFIYGLCRNCIFFIMFPYLRESDVAS